MVATSEERARLDPYSRIAENKDVTLQEKITGIPSQKHLVRLT
jgi:hypothetical protein